LEDGVIDADKASAHTRNQGQIMQNKWRITLVVVFSIGCFVGFGFLPKGELIFLVLFGAALIISLAAGARHLSLPARTFITTQIFCWNFMLCLLGRTVEPGITKGNTCMVLWEMRANLKR
jgi:hypothetical protein